MTNWPSILLPQSGQDVLFVLSSGGGGVYAGSRSLHSGGASLFAQRCPPDSGSRLIQDPGLRWHSDPSYRLTASWCIKWQGHLCLKGSATATAITAAVIATEKMSVWILSPQAVGEPPLFLAASVFYAIKDAISAARTESGISGPFRLDSPASAERIRNVCSDRFTKLVRKFVQKFVHVG